MSWEVMTAKELAKYLDISEGTIYKRVDTGEMPFVKIGRSLRFPKAIIDRWLADETVHPEKSLLDEFEILYEKFHLKKFLRAKGIVYDDLGDAELMEQLAQAIKELRDYENANKKREELLREGEL